MKKLIVFLLIAALAAGGGYWYYANAREKDKKEPEPSAKVEKGSLIETVASDGKVVSNLDVEIKCKASGEIIRLPFDVSDKVNKGDLLVALDPVDEQRNVNQAKAALNSSMAKLESAQLSLKQREENLATERKRLASALETQSIRLKDSSQKAERTRELLALKVASREEYESAQTAAATAEEELKSARLKEENLNSEEKALEGVRQEVRSAQSAVEIDRIALEIAYQRLENTKVSAPMEGVVTARNVQVGQIISSPISNVGGGTTVMVLSDLSRMFVLATVDEADIGRVRLGQSAKVTVDAYPGKQFAGKVVRISPRGVNVSSVVTFEAKIEVVSSDKDLLRPEMTANVEIEISRAENALLVPAESVQRKTGKSFVTILKGEPGKEEKEEREVKTGITDGRKTEVISGVAEGETVLSRKGQNETKWQGRQPSPRAMMGVR